jgi:hypothetical protein
MKAMFTGAPADDGTVYTTPLQVKKALDQALHQGRRDLPDRPLTPRMC